MKSNRDRLQAGVLGRHTKPAKPSGNPIRKSTAACRARGRCRDFTKGMDIRLEDNKSADEKSNKTVSHVDGDWGVDPR